ncbi:MAG: DUF134 domain-containing protein [Chloroflexi bacterium]|nr:DUF134 domain-containing protein [Chloroflexota bacterium]
MPRPRKNCKVAFLPGTTFFKPAGVPLRLLDKVCIYIEEIESLRLRDIENLDQAQCARYMNISRATFQRILESARKKIAVGILGGKAIKIDGGAFELETPQCCCRIGCSQDVQAGMSARWSAESCSICHRLCDSAPVPPAINAGLANEDRNSLGQNNEIEIRRINDMKIAVVTDDEKTISQHFGQASLYVVYTVEDGKVTGKETRAKMGHRHFAFRDERPHVHGERHGFDLASVNRHASMAVTIKDSQVLIAGGMGMGAYQSMINCKIEPIVTDIESVEEAVKLYIEGKLPNLINRVH